MPDEKYRILLAEDDPNLGKLLADYLGSEGFEVMLCPDGVAALAAFRSQVFDLCLLDVMMPKVDGFTVAREIRAMDKTRPILFITARSLKEDKLRGYDLGADDYITKPFDEEELLWKIKAIVRRTGDARNGKNDGPVELGKFLFDASNQSLTIGGKSRRITDKECRILEYMARHRNQVIRREDMVQELWGKNDYFLGRSLDVFITKIRKYLQEDPAVSIENVFGVGFIFNVPEQKG